MPYLDRLLLMLVVSVLAMAASSCGKQDQRASSSASSTAGSDPTVAPSTIHLAGQVSDGEADVDSAGPPASARAQRVWTFDVPRPEWQSIAAKPRNTFVQEVELQQQKDSVRLAIASPDSTTMHACGIQTDLGELSFADWETVIIRARTSDRFAGVTVACNVEKADAVPGPMYFFVPSDGAAPVFNDGSVQSYAIPLREHGAGKSKTLRSVGIVFAAFGKADVDILSITLVPRGAAFLEKAGVRHVTRGGMLRHSIFAHAPAVLRFPVDIPEGARLDLGLTAYPGEKVRYTVATERDGERRVWLEEAVSDADAWQHTSIDLADLGAGPAEIVLEAASAQEGAVALWGAPILTGSGRDTRPNIIFYVIDGGDADLMSLYEYDRPTTPFLEKLAADAVVFTRAYSNATWTQPSTASFMTSLHHSVLGGLRRGVHSTAIPPEAVTMADHFRAAGYRTASFTANPNAGRIIGINQGVDVMRDLETAHHSTSSIDLHEIFFDFRSHYPGGPYWVHFQTTDVHEPNEPVKPFAHRWVSKKQHEQLEQWDNRLWQLSFADFGTTSVAGFYDMALERAEIDRQAYFALRRGLYDETMAHQDHALEKLIASLEKAGEWDNTLLVIGSDHGHPAGTFARFGRGEFEPQPEPWQGAMFDAYTTRIPLLFVWPGKIEGGRRIDQPVSMIDVLPTLLDLAGLPQPDVLQGHSLAPLLRGESTELPPVILDEFRVDETTGEWIGNLEIIDGRWGASLEVSPVKEGADPTLGRHAVPAGGRWGAVHPYFDTVPRLLLYDLEKDPFALKAVNADHPDLVRHYTSILEKQWQAHQALGTQFSSADAAPLTQEQLEQLRNLGYIR